MHYMYDVSHWKELLGNVLHWMQKLVRIISVCLHVTMQHFPVFLEHMLHQLHNAASMDDLGNMVSLPRTSADLANIVSVPLTPASVSHDGNKATATLIN